MPIPHSSIWRIAGSAILAFCAAVVPATLSGRDAGGETRSARAALDDVEKIVFLGDSITQGGDYVVDVQCWLLARGIEVNCINLGLGSETATNLTPEENAWHLKTYQFARPAISERLGRVLEMSKPDLLFVCYGMNDGGSLPADESGLKRFSEAVTRLRETALKSGVNKVVLCTPPLHDDKGDASRSYHDANLTRYTSWLLSKRKDGWDVVDFHTPMRKALDDGRTANPAFALAADGTHPGREGHWIMAKQLLQRFFHAETITAATAEDLFPRHGKEIRGVVRELTDLRFRHWMSRIGHNRPGVPGGPGQAEPSDDAGFAARESACLQRIHALCKPSSLKPEPASPE